MRTERDSKWYVAECVLRDYHKNKVELEKLKREIAIRTPAKPEISTGTTLDQDRTAERGIECVEGAPVLRYEADIKAVEKLIGTEKEVGEYEHHIKWFEIRTAINLRYWKGTHSMQGVSLWLQLNHGITISDRWLGELVSGFIWRLRDVLYGCESSKKVI